jgi:tetratricopeptide (TPR) repeat protein
MTVGWALGTELGLLLVLSLAAMGADVAEARRQFLSGRYAESMALAQQGLRDQQGSEEWQLLLTEGLLTTGQYPQARAAVTNALAKAPRSIRLRWLAREVFLSNGQTNAAAQMVEELKELVATRPWAYREAPNLVIFGRAALLEGADPKRVLDRVFEAAKKANPTLRGVYLASGELALQKHDFALAAKTFQEGLKSLPEDPDLHCGLAAAYAPTDQKLMLESLAAALARNTNHVPSLLLLADQSIDAEDYAAAQKLLERVQTVNRWHPEAWAYLAVVAHVQNRPEAEVAARQSGLKFWPANPRVDHLIGVKLSQKYRFAVGASHQHQALKLDRGYLPAKAQLAQDLLRLGEEAQGWRLAEEVEQQDAYDVAAHNLAALRQTLSKFQTLTNQHFVLRMSPHEAALYGPRALALLEEARGRLCAKYGLELKPPTLVEIFPEQKDFAVRTFGLPENNSFLGVCFGQVITANSPAARPGRPFNWEAMLWHEFCHVVTLQLTRNKMPRWLSEGISVYEERQANPAWGEQLRPAYRELLLGEELTPIAKLSGAFLTPRSGVELQFAYYQSSLVVQFMVERFGQDKLIAILRELGEGADINQALEKHTAPMAKNEQDFRAYARRTAENLAPGLDWEKPPLETVLGAGRQSRRAQSASSPQRPAEPPAAADEQAWNAWAIARPTNFWVMSWQAQRFIENKQWTDAQPILQRLVELYPGFTGSDSAYRLLAATHRALGQTNAERQVLARFAEKDAQAADAYLRLMELATDAQDWPAVAHNAQRYLAVAPLVATPYRFLARSSEALGQVQTAIAAYRALLQLDPPNPAEAHFRLAKLLRQTGDPAARRHLLQALEEAPRYREALRLLLEMHDQPAAKPQAAAAQEADR